MDYDFLPVSDGTGDAALMHVSADRSVGDLVVVVDTVSKVPSKFIATSGTLLPTGLLNPSTITNFKGHLDGSNIAIDSFEPGSSDIGHTEGQVVIIKPNTGWANRVAKFIKNATGTGTPEAVFFDQITVNTGATLPASVIGTSQLAFGAATEDKWRNNVAFYTRLTNDVSIGTAQVFTKLSCNTVDYDLGSDYSTVNSRFTAPFKGIYHFDGVVGIPNNTNRAIVSIFVNGSEARRGTNGNWSSTLNRVSVSADLLLESSDVVELYVYRETTGVVTTDAHAQHGTGWGGHLVTRVDS